MNQLICTGISSGTSKLQGWFNGQSRLFEKIAHRFPGLFLPLYLQHPEKKGKIIPEKIIIASDGRNIFQPPGNTGFFLYTPSILFKEKVCIEKKLEEAIENVGLSSENRTNKFKVINKEKHNIPASKKALGILFKNLLMYLNEQNQGENINLNVMEDEDYTVMVAEHRGRPLSRLELKRIYQSAPSQIVDSASALLYYCLHILKATGGWLTTGERQKGLNYISLGLPKL